MKVKKNPISNNQMSSIHIAYREWAALLNESGYTINKAIKQNLLRVDVPFTESNVKEIFGYNVIKALFPEKFADSDAPKHPRLTTTEVQLVFETINMGMGERFGISIPFPEKYDDE